MRPDDLAAEEWTPNWRDDHGVVHIMGTHTAQRAYTECGVIAASRSSRGPEWTSFYEAIRDPVTCIACLRRDAEGPSFESMTVDFLRKKIDQPSLMSQVLRPASEVLDDDE